jgi:opine dehydrogenase
LILHSDSALHGFSQLSNLNVAGQRNKFEIAVLGAGHGGLAMAGHLALMGHKVNLFNRGEERQWGVRSSGTIEITVEVEGFGCLNMATTSMKKAIEGVELIMVLVPAFGHLWMAEQMAPHLADDQIVVLHPG